MANNFTKRIIIDEIAQKAMFVFTIATFSMVLVIGLGLIINSAPIFEHTSLWTLITSTSWRPAANEFGFLPFIMGTLLVTGLAIILAFPLSLFTSIYISEFSNSKIKKIVFTVLDILAGIPSVVYGVWGTVFIVPIISDWLAPNFVDYSTGYSLLAGAVVLCIMILPLLTSLFVEIFSSVSNELRDAALALGATKWQTSKHVVIKKTLPGIIASIVLTTSRAFGETIAVLMVCGNIAIIPETIFDGVYPLTALIANNYGEMLSIPLYQSALMLAAFMLFIVVFVFNAISRAVIYRLESNEY